MATSTIKCNMVKLWENIDPTTAFAAQSLSVNLNGCTAVFVAFSAILGGSVTGVFPLGSRVAVKDWGTSSSNLAMLIRPLTATNTGISFEDCEMRVQGTSAMQTRNQYLIPLEIYGIKA